jgi:RNA polymerase sigma-70 factor (ECF subfamily)
VTHQERERLFVDLFTRNKERIHRLCYGYLNSGADAEDLFQEVMTNVWNSLSRFRGEAKPETWLYRVAVNTALMYRRRRHRSEPLGDLPDQRAGADQNLEQRERLDALRTAIAALPDQDRLIVTLLLEDLSYREIAEITGITANHVGVKISRIKQALEQLMSAAPEVPHGAV